MPGVAHAAEGFYDRDSDARAAMSVGSNTSASSPSSTVALVDGARVADPMELSGTFASDLRRRLTYETPIVVEKGTGLPLNPRGRTGLKGRAFQTFSLAQAAASRQTVSTPRLICRMRTLPLSTLPLSSSL